MDKQQEEELERIGKYMGMSNALFVLYAHKVELKIAHEVQRNTDFLFAVVSDENKVSKDYPFDYYLDLLIGGYYIEIENNDNKLSKQLNLIYEAKDKMLEMIYRAKKSIGKRSDIIIDFDGRLERVNSKIEKLHTQLEMQKYDLEVSKLKHETSWVIRYLPYIVSVLALVVSILGLLIGYSTSKDKPQKVQVEILKAK